MITSIEEIKYSHLEGLPYVQGKTDCLDILIRMFYDNLGIVITNFARPNDWWIEEGLNFYMDHYEGEGFFMLDNPKLSELRPFDVFLIAIPDERRPKEMVANHCAIYLGDGKIIHHRYGKLSKVQEYRHAMKDMTVGIIRHKDVPDLTNRKESSVDIMDRILPHKRELLQGVLDAAQGQDQ